MCMQVKSRQNNRSPRKCAGLRRRCSLSRFGIAVRAFSRCAGLRCMRYLAALACGICFISRHWLSVYAFSRGNGLRRMRSLAVRITAHTFYCGAGFLHICPVAACACSKPTHTARPLTYQPHPRAGYPHVHGKARALATAYPHGDMQNPRRLMHMFMTKRTVQCRHIPALPAICTPASTFCRNFIHSRDDMCMRLSAPWAAIYAAALSLAAPYVISYKHSLKGN